MTSHPLAWCSDHPAERGWAWREREPASADGCDAGWSGHHAKGWELHGDRSRRLLRDRDQRDGREQLRIQERGRRRDGRSDGTAPTWRGVQRLAQPGVPVDVDADLADPAERVQEHELTR